MSAMTVITEAIGQVRSELRVVNARDLPRPSRPVVNDHLCGLELGIRQFKFGLVGERRSDPLVQAVIRDLHRLHEDLLHELSQGSEADEPAGEDEELLVIRPLGRLVVLLSGKLS